METTNHEYFVSLEVANLLKEAGFDWNCNGAFLSEDGTQYAFIKMDAAWNSNISKCNPYNISAPTLDVAQRWLREVKGYNVLVSHNFELNTHGWWILQDNDMLYCNYGTQFDTYEEALEAGIKKALEIMLKKGE